MSPADSPSEDLLASISPPSDVHERQRIEDYLKRPFQTPITSEGDYARSDFSNLLAVFAGLAQDFTDIRTEVLCSRYLNTAAGTSLNEIGRLAQLPRNTSESDAHYRVRIQARFRQIVGNCTVDDVREAAALLLDIPVGDVQFEEPFDETVASVRLNVSEAALDASPVTAEEFVELVGAVSAAGVDVEITAEGAFKPISLAELRAGTDLPDSGYDEAGYSGRLNQ